MKIWKNLRTENIFLDVPLPDKKAALRFVADVCTKNGIATDADAIFKGLNQREQTMSTGIGNGIGFPHTATGKQRMPLFSWSARPCLLSLRVWTVCLWILS